LLLPLTIGIVQEDQKMVLAIFALPPFYLHLCLFEKKNGFEILVKFGSFVD
jgi:hypothetical protein